jgi:hypothetical protein
VGIAGRDGWPAEETELDMSTTTTTQVPTGFDAGSAATLITLHTVAALIVVPTLARRLARVR